MFRCVWVYAAAVVAGLGWSQLAAAQEPTLDQGLLEFKFTPTPRAQFALWVETADGEFMATVRLTEATAMRGIGNRPGASQMNSGFRWPFGRREGVLPVWATRRASAPDARQFKRVIFQDRRSEGLASRTSNDQSPEQDDYYCLSFNASRAKQDALDAVSCASPFNSDKGRFITKADVAAGYGEPYETPGGAGRIAVLSINSLYPPRRDATYCVGCNDHIDLDMFDAHAHEVMPDIDAVTMATPAGGPNNRQRVLFAVPGAWPAGDYRACLEINTEGDHNDAFTAERHPTPRTPDGQWDSWAMNYGYPYRGQPSVLYCLEFSKPTMREVTVSTSVARGAIASWDTMAPGYGVIDDAMEGMSDDPTGEPGSGADRLLSVEGDDRLTMTYRPALMCDEDLPPGAVSDLEVRRYPEDLHAHDFALMTFGAAGDDHGIYEYQVVVSRDVIDAADEASFMAATQAKRATIEQAKLEVPIDAAEGETISIELGGLAAETDYYIAVRAMDGCAATGQIAVVQYRTPARVFTTVEPCFIATAAFGSPLASEVGTLRRFRDRYLLNHAPGRAAVALYYAYGPMAADFIAGRDRLRAAVRWVLSPLIAAAELLDD